MSAVKFACLGTWREKTALWCFYFFKILTDYVAPVTL